MVKIEYKRFVSFLYELSTERASEESDEEEDEDPWAGVFTDGYGDAGKLSIHSKIKKAYLTAFKVSECGLRTLREFKYS